ncbi:hypothetical protein [Virgibacillus litoralis]|uniref:Uncharacterized protein n=1 Tax=Virgibacillus litoralis TaxID=578221 RepID=A0ABS4HFQ9_9BACI|nr:hypothetical protein [Virgibacillus litoralis]MBP1949779.1 hypothetical protein [Virgibacillus litoralis]
MAIYKPVKKWLLPLLSIVIGLSMGYALFLSKEDYQYSQWVTLLEDSQTNRYKIESAYKWDNNVYSKSQGIWSEENSYYQIATPISDGDEFSFEAYVFEEEFYLKSSGEWFVGTFPHSFTEELAPLNNPLKWAVDVLKHAEHISKNKNRDYVTYKATFKAFPSIDFRGTLLSKQDNTYLEMTFKRGEPFSLEWVVNPIHPDSLGPLVSYPETLTYRLSFDTTKNTVPALPAEAKEAEEID